MNIVAVVINIGLTLIFGLILSFLQRKFGPPPFHDFREIRIPPILNGVGLCQLYFF